MRKLEPDAMVLNALCPYFTMFPLTFPLSVLAGRARRGDEVLDPFCGRGTTNYAARLLGLDSVGVDASPVAVATTAAKLVAARPEGIIKEVRGILDSERPAATPSGSFWRLAFHGDVLAELCRIRAALLRDCVSPTRRALRGIVLGALHGPKQQAFPSYFSNQCPRTYAPKPAYATRYWRRYGCRPERVNVVDVITRRAYRYYSYRATGKGAARLADSRYPSALRPRSVRRPFRWVITSPPYYGMRTYVADQWLRHWFLGGPDVVDYQHDGQIRHQSPEAFTDDLRKVWRNAARACTPDARLVVRFGGISDRASEPLEVVKTSLEDSGWCITTLRSAGTANAGRRQAETFLTRSSKALVEYDVWARLR